MILLNLDALLKKRGMTQQELAVKAGLSRNTISKIVNQPAQVRLDTLDVLCDALDCTVDDLFVRVRLTEI